METNVVKIIDKQIKKIKKDANLLPQNKVYKIEALEELRLIVSRVELPVKPASGGQTGNEPIDDTFIYKIVLQDTVIDEQKEKRFVLARNFDDATQLASEMCEGNDWCVIRIKEIGYLDYCTGVIVKYFSRLSV